MAEIRTVTTLQLKRQQIVASISHYETQLEQARADLASINAVIRVFEAGDDPRKLPVYADTYRLFTRGEKWALCKKALAETKELTTRQIALYIMAAKGFDLKDSVLVLSMTRLVTSTLRIRWLRGELTVVGKCKGMSVWRLP
jgi:hypothetical protein